MQDHGLLISSIIRHAAQYHGQRHIASRESDGSLCHTNYASVERRSRRLAALLVRLGIRAGDRVATLAFNTFRHLECFYGISGMGAVLHTVNPRLFPEQIAYIVNHAENRALFFDAPLFPLVESIAPELKTIEHFIVLGDHATVQNVSWRSPVSYEELIESSHDDFSWPRFDERTAASLCYTSGTTGHPKGVLYSHRSTLLHAWSTLQPDSFGLRAVDVVLPIVPMYHVHAWSTPYGCPMVGAGLVLPGHQLDPLTLVRLLQAERVTFALGVPTVWSTLINYLRQSGESLGSLERAVIGGSALPAAVHNTLQEGYGVRAIHAWGMTETSPIGAVSALTPELMDLPEAERTTELLKQGRPPFGVEFKVTEDGGRTVPSDGMSPGLLWIRGPWVAAGYFRHEDDPIVDADGWFPTGDIATIDTYGFMKITDRTKDVIKSGGEWISSIELENLAMLHPQVRLAAAVAADHPTWGERPILIVVPAGGQSLTPDVLLEFLRPRMPKWWLPDAVVFASDLPLTATGKVRKAMLRREYRQYLIDHSV